MRKLALFLWLGLSAAPAFAFQPPAWAVGQSVYEVNLETFSKEGNFKALEQRLPELKALGVGILWLMPVTERGVEKAFGSPYCVKDYKALHKPFGSNADFKHLVAEAHKIGLYVIVDWVANHTSWDNALLKEHPEYYKKDAAGKIVQAQTWADVAQLDFSQAGLRAYMVDAMDTWVRDFDIDGFRCDVAWNVPMEFWVSARKKLEARKPLYFLAEASGPQYQEAFDSDYDWDLMNLGGQPPLVEIAAGRKAATAIDAVLRRDYGKYKAPFTRLRYISNHDEWKDKGTPEVRFKGGDQAMAVLTALLPGRILLYNGQEIGWQQQKGVIDWSASTRSAEYRSLYMRLLQLRQEEPALEGGAFLKLQSDQEDTVYAFARQSGLRRVLCVLNLSPRPQAVHLRGEGLLGAYEDAFSGAARHFQDEDDLSLEPWAYRVYLSETAPLMSEEALSRGPVAPAKAAVAACGASPTALADWPASFTAAWDAERLYVEVQVEKAKIIHDSSNDTPWDDDSVEVYLDLKRDRSPEYGADDSQFIVGFKNPKLFQAKGRTAGVEFSTMEGKPNVMRLSIPWKTLAWEPKEGQVIGFDVGLNLDKDGGARDLSVQWNGSDQNYHDTSGFGDLRLGAPCKPWARKQEKMRSKP